MTRSGSYRGKRLLDLVLLVATAVPAGVVGLAVALAVRISSPGPVLLRIPRVGLAGGSFTMFKFRTTIDAHDDHPPLDDPRTTTVGRLIRRASLDELPQLLNVARGEMSFVGPRPTCDHTITRYSPDQWLRVSVRPGITGRAQVEGRNHLDWAQRLAADLVYVRTQSMPEDMRLLAATVRAAVSGHGAELPVEGDTGGYWVGPSENRPEAHEEPR